MARPEPQPRVLVVDDEPAITDLVGMALRYEGFQVSTASSGRAALRAAEEERPDLVVLDVMLPDLDGVDVCRRLRATGDVPVVFLTARDATTEKITALTVGGDDYLTKPFSVAELIARIRAVLRRAGRGTAADPVLRYADLTLDAETYEVRRNDALIELTATEFRLLRYLMVNAGRVVSKAQILDHVWHYDSGRNENIVEAYMSYLRKKIDNVEPSLLHTLRGVGYSLRLPRR